MFLILGINHSRCVGVWELDGTIEDFNPENTGGYRSPITDAERTACVAKGLEYYNLCGPSVRVGEFGLQPLTKQAAEELGDRLAEQSMDGYADIDFLEFLKKMRRCDFCGKLFFPTSLCQKVCTKPECQQKRKASKALAYYHRQKKKK